MFLTVALPELTVRNTRIRRREEKRFIFGIVGSESGTFSFPGSPCTSAGSTSRCFFASACGFREFCGSSRSCSRCSASCCNRSSLFWFESALVPLWNQMEQRKPGPREKAKKASSFPTVFFFLTEIEIWRCPAVEEAFILG